MLVSPPDLQWDSGGGDGARRYRRRAEGLSRKSLESPNAAPIFQEAHLNLCTYLIQNIRRSEGSGFHSQSLEMSMSLNCCSIVRITPRSKLQTLQVF